MGPAFLQSSYFTWSMIIFVGRAGSRAVSSHLYGFFLNSCSGCFICCGKHILFVLILCKILCEVNLLGFRGLFIN